VSLRSSAITARRRSSGVRSGDGALGDAVYVPEPGAFLLLACALPGLAGAERVGWRRPLRPARARSSG
jgi:hypothetical protein